MENLKAKNKTIHRNFNRDETPKSKLMELVDKMMISSKKKTILSIHFAIISAIFTYEIISYYSFDQSKIQIESKIEGDQVFKYENLGFYYFTFFKLIVTGVFLSFLSILPYLIVKVFTKINPDLTIHKNAIVEVVEIVNMALILAWMHRIQKYTSVFIICLIIIVFQVVRSKDILKRRLSVLFFFLLIFILIGAVYASTILSEIAYLSRKYHFLIKNEDYEKLTDYMARNLIKGEEELIEFIKGVGFDTDDVIIGKSEKAFKSNASFYIPGICKYIIMDSSLLHSPEDKEVLSLTKGANLPDDVMSHLLKRDVTKPVFLQKSNINMFKGVFIHELGHIRKFHGLIHFVILKFAFLIAMSVCGWRSFRNGNFKRITHGLIIILVLCQLNEILMNSIGHLYEYQADNYLKTHCPECISAAIQVLVKPYSENSKERIFYPRFSIFSTHPSNFHRIQNFEVKIENGVIKLE